MHGQYIRSIYRQLISEEGMFLWLLSVSMIGETECEIIAAQDQVLQTKYRGTKMSQIETTNADYFSNFMRW